jgi:hypothetical protein
LKSGLLLAFPRALTATDDAAVEPQPYFANVRRVVEALRLLGEPIASADDARIMQLAKAPSAANVRKAEEILARYTLMRPQVPRDVSSLSRDGGHSSFASRTRQLEQASSRRSATPQCRKAI